MICLTIGKNDIVNVMKHERFPVLIVAASSLAALAYEIILIRVFSISLWYHFAFMIISIAMLGIGASGTVLSFVPKASDNRAFPFYPLLVGLSISISYLISNFIPFDPARMAWDRMQLLYIALYPLVLSTPFLFSGLLISTAFMNLRRNIGTIYAADLLGAGVGSLVTLWLLQGMGPEKAIFIVACLPLLPLIFLQGRYLKLLTITALLVNIALTITGPDFALPRISPYKPLSLALQFPGARHLQVHYSPYSRVDIFTSPAARFAPGLSLRYLNDLPEQAGISVDAGDISAITDQRKPTLLTFIDYLPASLPYALTSRKDVLVIDPRGGLSTLMAQYYHSQNVHSVESNPLLIQAVQEYSRRIGSDLFAHQIWQGLGRTWLAASDKAFDIMDLSLTGSLPHSAFGFAEDYRFTVEAFRIYLEHLKPGGILSLNLFVLPPLRTELRLMASIAVAAEQSGIDMFSRHTAVVRSWDTLTMIVKKAALTAHEIERIRHFCKERQFDLLYYPGIKQHREPQFIRTSGHEYADDFQRVIDPLSRKGFITEYLFDIRPAQDDRPFFYYYLKLKNLSAIYRLMGEKWFYFVEEGYLLPILLLQITVVSIILILLPLLKRRGGASKYTAENFRVFVYFSCLGFGYLFIEVGLIQKVILPLEHPPYAMSTVILALLLGSGCGSFLSAHIPAVISRRVIMGTSLLIVLYTLLWPDFIQALLAQSLPTRIALVFLIVIPAGFLMGVPFPLGLSLLGERNEKSIPWAWAINGCSSVLAPVIAVMIALSTGFNTVLLIAALLYFIVYMIFPKLKDSYNKQGG
jgi:hypothetical protein